MMERDCSTGRGFGRGLREMIVLAAFIASACSARVFLAQGASQTAIPKGAANVPVSAAETLMARSRLPLQTASAAPVLD